MSDAVFLGTETTPALQELSSGSYGYLLGAEAHHAAKVKRLRPGESFALVDGNGRRVNAEALSEDSPGGSSFFAEYPDLKGKGLFFQVKTVQQVGKLPLRLGLIQALAKGGRDEQAVESAVEIGAMEITPWLSSRCVVQWKGDKKVRQGLKKWDDQIKAAAKQSRRSLWPKLNNLTDTRALAKQISQDSQTLYLLLEGESSQKISAAFSEYQIEKTGGNTAGTGTIPELKVQVIVGPEGGISAEEITLLEQAGAVSVRLGKSVLRSSSAGPAALAVLAAQGGLWDIECF